MGEGVALSATDIVKAFGGVRVLDHVTVSLEEGECHALIGPNGAGKTTLFNIITGEIKPDKGKVFLFGKDITRASIRLRTFLGLGRTYQVINVFEDLSVKENLLLSIYNSFKNNNFEKHIEKICNVVKFKIENFNVKVKELSYGEKRKLDLALALAKEPRVLLLDEPTAGLSQAEREDLKKVLYDLKTSLGVTLFLVEHDVSFAFDLADKVTVLNHGKVLATGTPTEITSNHQVAKIYFGSLE